MALIYETPDTLEADILVCLVHSESDADMLIYEDEMGESNRLQDWIYVDEPDEAQYVVAYVEDADEADLAIYFVEDPDDAKLVNQEKKRFF